MQKPIAAVFIAGISALGVFAASAVAQVVASVQPPGPAAVSVSPVARIKAGEINCAHCDLSGADLSYQCVKNGDLTGANFDRVTARYMCMSFANFTAATFRGADLTGANLTRSVLKDADLSGATLSITSIKGTDLSTARGLTQAQIDRACGDADTKLPAHLHVKTCS